MPCPYAWKFGGGNANGLGLGVVAGAGADDGAMLADFDFEGVIFIGTISGLRIEGEDVVGSGIGGAFRDVGGEVVAGIVDGAAALNGEDLEGEVGGVDTRV